MPSPFNSPLFQLADFEFVVAGESKGAGDRGQPAFAKEITILTLYLNPTGYKGDAKVIDSAKIDTEPTYNARVMAVNGNPNEILLPHCIKPGATGRGLVNAVPCEIKITSITQGAIAIIPKILGSSLQCQLSYRGIQGVAE